MIKKKLVLTLCAATMLLAGCQSSNAMLLEYSDINLLKSVDVLDIVPPATMDAFTKNTAVIAGDGVHGDSSGASVSVDTTDAPEAETADPADQDGAAEVTDVQPEDDAAAESEDDTAEQDQPGLLEDGLTDTPALLVNRTTNEVLYYNDAFAEVPPASLTKLMTALLALKYGNLSDEVTLTAEMNQNIMPGAQTCGYMAGDKMTLETLFRSMIVYSGNETANAIAVHVGGSISNFVTMMNEEAKRIGCTNTSFVNTNGLDVGGHYSSVYDLYLIFNECMKYDAFVSAMETANLKVTYESYAGGSRTAEFPNTNWYLQSLAESPEGMTVYGGKTGTTGEAGACLICYVIDDAGNDYIAVSLGNKEKEELYSQMNKILSKILN